jgi:hypothetical protein
MLPDEHMTQREFGQRFMSKREFLLLGMFVEVLMKYRRPSTAIGSVIDALRARSPRSRDTEAAVRA